MARLADLKLSYRLFMKTYSYRQASFEHLHVPTKLLSACRVGLVTSAGLYGPDDAPFDESIKGGDWSWRVIPQDAELSRYRIGHRSDAWDESGVESDPNLGLPLNRLRELVDSGEVGSVAPRHASIQGSITAPSRLVSETAPEIAQMFKEDQVDLVLLTPV